MTRSFIKTLKSALLAVGALAAIAFAAPASATCYGYGCGGGTPAPTPTPAPAPAPTPTNFNFEITTGAAFLGNGTGEAIGAHRAVEVYKDGFARTNSAFNLGGSFCQGLSCANGSFTAEGAAGESVWVNTLARDPSRASANNFGNAATMLQGGVIINKPTTGTP